MLESDPNLMLFNRNCHLNKSSVDLNGIYDGTGDTLMGRYNRLNPENHNNINTNNLSSNNLTLPKINMSVTPTRDDGKMNKESNMKNSNFSKKTINNNIRK